MKDNFERDLYKKTMAQVKVPASMRSRILNMDVNDSHGRAELGSHGAAGHRRAGGRRRVSAVLITCLLIVLVSGTALAVSKGDSLRGIFQKEWKNWNGEEMGAQQLAVIDNLTTPLGLSQTVGNITVTLDSVVYGDGVFWMLVNAVDVSGGAVFDSDNAYGYVDSTLEITADDGTDLTWGWGANTYASLDSSTVHMLIDGELNPDLAPEMEGQTATFRLTLTDLRNGNEPEESVMLQDGTWEFQFQIPLTGVEDSIRVDSFEAEQMLPGGAMARTQVNGMEITPVGVTYWCAGETVVHTELPRLLLKNGSEVGCGGGLSEQQEDESWKVHYQWTMPVDLSQIAAVQLGNTVVEVEP